jgi:hypothetical protein
MLHLDLSILRNQIFLQRPVKSAEFVWQILPLPLTSVQSDHVCTCTVSMRTCKSDSTISYYLPRRFSFMPAYILQPVFGRSRSGHTCAKPPPSLQSLSLPRSLAVPATTKHSCYTCTDAMHFPPRQLFRSSFSIASLKTLLKRAVWSAWCQYTEMMSMRWSLCSSALVSIPIQFGSSFFCGGNCW